jgi:hypothetical protein
MQLETVAPEASALVLQMYEETATNAITEYSACINRLCESTTLLNAGFQRGIDGPVEDRAAIYAETLEAAAQAIERELPGLTYTIAAIAEASKGYVVHHAQSSPAEKQTLLETKLGLVVFRQNIQQSQYATESLNRSIDALSAETPEFAAARQHFSTQSRLFAAYQQITASKLGDTIQVIDAVLQSEGVQA